MPVPVIQKIIFDKEVFVERRVSPGGRLLVEEGSAVRPFDFVAEIEDGVRRHLTAGVGGRVVKLLPGKAVLIRTSAVVVYGVIGKGEDDEGEIKIAAEYDAPIELSAIDSNCVGDILVGGFVPNLEVFKKAEAVGVKGIVCGGADFAAFQKSDLPTLLVEGFGHPPLDNKVAEFLQKVEGRHVFLSPGCQELLVARYPNGKEDQHLIEERPVEAPLAFVDLKKGMELEIFDAANFGQMGKVEKVVGDEVEVVLDNGDKIIVPGRNIGIVR